MKSLLSRSEGNLLILLILCISMFGILDNLPHCAASLSVSLPATKRATQFAYLFNTTLHSNIVMDHLNGSELILPEYEVQCGGREMSLDRARRFNILRLICLHCSPEEYKWLLKCSYDHSMLLIGVHPYMHYIETGLALTRNEWNNFTIVNQLINTESTSPYMKIYGTTSSEKNVTTKHFITSTASLNQTVILDLLVVCKQQRNETEFSVDTITINGKLTIIAHVNYLLYLFLIIGVVFGLCCLGCVGVGFMALWERRIRGKYNRYSIILKNNNAWSMMKEEIENSRHFKDIDYVQTIN